MAVLSPWYPEAQTPYGGAFVEAMVEAVAPGLDRVDVYHIHTWPLAGSEERRRPAWELHARLLPRSVPPAATVGGAALHRIPALVPRTQEWIVHSDAYAHWLGTALEGRPIEAPVLHAHIPILTAWAALQHCRPDAAVYATEHSSFLPAVLEQPAARERYDEILERCAGFFVVGEFLHRQLAETFPRHADKIEYVANPIRFSPERRTGPAGLARWLAVASFKEVKRTDYLLRAFAACRREYPELTLTLAGDGRLRPDLEELCDELGVRDAVEFLGMVEPSAVPGIMAEHDLLVHPSSLETFGVVVVEAVAAGIPVLVTRCGGPERVLEGIEDDVGVLVEVDDDPEVLVAGYRALRERHPEKTNLDRAREVLRDKYSYASVAERHYRIWYGE